MPQKRVFDIDRLDLNAFATSLGLVTVPTLKFVLQRCTSVAADANNASSGAAETDGSVNEESVEGTDASTTALRVAVREKKNVNKKLARLKEQIAKERLRKRIARGDKEGVDEAPALDEPSSSRKKKPSHS